VELWWVDGGAAGTGDSPPTRTLAIIRKFAQINSMLSGTAEAIGTESGSQRATEMEMEMEMESLKYVVPAESGKMYAKPPKRIPPTRRLRL